MACGAGRFFFKGEDEVVLVDYDFSPSASNREGCRSSFLLLGAASYVVVRFGCAVSPLEP